MNQKSAIAFGLMSGTSADGVDVAAIRTDGERHIRFLAAQTVPYPAPLHERLITIAQDDCSFVELLDIERQLTVLHAVAVQELMSTCEQPTVIGFHGHTVRHIPEKQLTWQIGNASLLAEATGIQVVSDFRRRDVAAGGQGAPLAPLYHAALLPSGSDYPVCVLNLGGVGNLTWLGGGPNQDVVAGDTGPGCGLLDAWSAEKTGEPFDRNGELARAGHVDEETVHRAMAHPYFAKPFPKSADRYEFRTIDVSKLNPSDGAATLCAITAQAVAQSVGLLPKPAVRWLLTGGGSYHPVLVEQLQQRLPNVQSVSSIGARPDSLEAECFAWLAVRHIRGLPTSMPTTTGTIVPTVGGVATAK